MNKHILSKRVTSLEESGIRKVFKLATEGGKDLVNLSIGQPHFPAPHSLKDAACAAVQKDANVYTPTLGIHALREAIARKLKKENNIAALSEDIIVTSGVSGSIFLALGSIVDPGDEVILPDPYFLMYKEILVFLGAKIVYLDTYPDFRIDPQKLNGLITPKTKALIINSPNNPTGVVYTRQELETIAHIADRHGLLVISDEIYEAFDYTGSFFSIGSIYQNTVTMNGFSKSHAIPGWRIGFAHAPRPLIEAMNVLQQYTFVCAPSFAQHALIEALGHNVELEDEIARYITKRDLVYGSLKDLYELHIPEGAFYAFIKNPKGRKNFTEELAQNGVLVVPGDVFSQRNDHFRISFAVPDEQLKKGLAILQKAASDL